MACYYPITLTENEIIKKSIITAEEYNGKGLIVPCGKCVGCLITKRNQWTFRLMEEFKVSSSSHFLTLTYNDENIPHSPNSTPYQPSYMFNKTDVQKYIKRVRKENESKLKYYFVSEYGDKTQRPHYHAIIFNSNADLLKEKWSNEKGELGHVQIGSTNQASIHYVTKYVINKQDYANRQKNERPFALISKGLGRAYAETTRMFHANTKNYTVFYPGGIRQTMPRYYRDKLYDEKTQREIAAKIINEKNNDETWEQWKGKKDRREIIAIQNSKSTKI